MTVIDDDPASIIQDISMRPRHTNARAGVEQIHIDFQGKGYGARRGFIFIMNVKRHRPVRHRTENDTCMKNTCEVIFAQMNKAKSEKEYGQMSDNASFK